LEAVVRKALEKDRNLRYQHASEMRSDLQRLKRHTESGHYGAVSSATAKVAAEAPAILKERVIPKKTRRAIIAWTAVLLAAALMAGRSLLPLASRQAFNRQGHHRGRGLR
jgi:hypothetical protein